jgi:hypothetical protein
MRVGSSIASYYALLGGKLDKDLLRAVILSPLGRGEEVRGTGGR